MSYGSLSKALLPKSVRSQRKHERPSIAAIVEPSVSTAILFASATLVPSPSSYIFSQTSTPATRTEEESTTSKEARDMRTLRRVKAKIELRATTTNSATAQMERTTTSTSTATTASSGSSHVPSTVASPVSSPFNSTNLPPLDVEDQMPGFGELVRRFSMEEEEEARRTLATSTECD